ncbi:MAG: hypothetical protein J6A75_07910 [Lachnospiraceae bacterium]|nr:hypothetical protein [Lachnospiraceae bacterium]
MADGMEFNREKCPTIQQVKYLMELEKMQGGRGMIAQIAANCHVNAASVSRYLKSCCEKGMLTKDYSLTAAGKMWLSNYKRIIEELYAYFRHIGIRESQIEENVKDMVENVGCYTLSTMLANHQKMRTTYVREKEVRSSRNFLREILPEKLDCEVYFMLFQSSGGTLKVSMANDGFQKPAILKHNRRGSCGK